MMEDFEGNDSITRTVLLKKDQLEKIKNLKKSGIIKRFNMSLFVRRALDGYIRRKEKKKKGDV
jgi:hypothetical protein